MQFGFNEDVGDIRVFIEDFVDSVNSAPYLDLTERLRLYVFGCGVGVEAGVGVGRSRPFCLESESELESAKFRRLRLQPGVAGYQPSTDKDFGRTVMHRPVNIGNRTKRRAVMWRLS